MISPAPRIIVRYIYSQTIHKRRRRENIFAETRVEGVNQLIFDQSLSRSKARRASAYTFAK